MTFPPALPVIHVVAAVLQTADGRVLICGRPAGKEMAGLWEFPGGKIELGEIPRAALARELREELHIELRAAQPFMRLQHDYPTKRVELDIWRVTAWNGEPKPLENQPLAWVTVDDLPAWQLLPADAPIVAALRLPDRYLVTPAPDEDNAVFLQHLAQALDTGIRLVQLRASALPADAYAALAEQVIRVCRARQARILLNAAPALAVELGADGVHLPAWALTKHALRPLPSEFWLGASCHNTEELAAARQSGADFAVIGPVRPTASHPQTVSLGWDGFTVLAGQAGMPVYAIGGLSVDDISQAQAAGGQGIAAIRGLWPA